MNEDFSITHGEWVSFSHDGCPPPNIDFYLNKRYLNLIKPLDDQSIDKICNKILLKNCKNGIICVCRMKDNSYSIFRFKDNTFILISKNHSKREMIKRKYISRDSVYKKSNKQYKQYLHDYERKKLTIPFILR